MTQIEIKIATCQLRSIQTKRYEAGKIHAKNLWKKDVTKNVHIFVLNFDFITRNIAQIQFF